MAFSFNWAGLSIPTVDRIENEVDMDAVGRNLGTAMRGYQNRRAAAEYADMIAGAPMQDDPRIAAIEAEIHRLESRNAELMRMARMEDERNGMIRNQSQQMAGYVPHNTQPEYGARQQMAGYGAYNQGLQGMGAPEYAGYRTR